MTMDIVKLPRMDLLVVEDAFLVAIDICAQLESVGCRITGPVARLRPALELARNEPIDGALLDVNLAGELSFPIAEALEARRIPFAFLTGYDDDAMFPTEFQDVPRLAKPFRHCDLVDLLIENFARRPRYVLT
jgi:CheY-like chemotaxis protein